MITKNELLELLYSTETYRIEKTISTTNKDKFCEAICAFANDMPHSNKSGYLLIGVDDNGKRSGLKVTDALLKNISSIRTEGNILPFPVMNVDYIPFEDGDVLVVEVTPSEFPPVRYHGRTYIRIGPRKDKATTQEESMLVERRSANFPTFDTTPCIEATLDDIDVKLFVNEYLPKAIDEEVLRTDTRSVKEQMASLRLYNMKYDCPTYASIILFGKNPKYFLFGDYVQYVHFEGLNNAAPIARQKEFEGNLMTLLPRIDMFIDDLLIVARPVLVTNLREEMVRNYPKWAVRELMMNALMHRDYKTNTPTKLYQYADRLEITNAGGLYGNARPENFPNVNDYRNPIVAEALRVLGYVNKFNRGIAMVQEELMENGNDKATFDVDNITVFSVKVCDSVSTKTNAKTNAKANAKANAIIKAIEENPGIQLKDLSETLQITPEGVRWHLNRLKQSGLIRREGSSRNGRWIVLYSPNSSFGDVAKQKNANCSPTVHQLVTNLSPQTKDLIINLKDSKKSASELQLVTSLSPRNKRLFREQCLTPNIEVGLLAMTHPETPRHPKQQYYLTELGLQVCRLIEESNKEHRTEENLI